MTDTGKGQRACWADGTELPPGITEAFILLIAVRGGFNLIRRRRVIQRLLGSVPMKTDELRTFSARRRTAEGRRENTGQGEGFLAAQEAPA